MNVQRISHLVFLKVGALALIVVGVGSLNGIGPTHQGTALRPVSFGERGASVPAPSTGMLIPHVVTLRDLPVIPKSSAHPLQRPAKKDRGANAEHEKRERSPISEIEADYRRTLAAQQPSKPAHIQQLRDVTPNPPAGAQSPASAFIFNLLSGFEGPDISQCCGGGALVPPDPHLAVGPNHAIAVVNATIAIYDKQGALLNGPVLSDNLFNSANCLGTFDPQVLYDESADRFIVNYDAAPNNCIAVTQSGNPTGAWNVYSFAGAAGSDFYDYPHAGVGDQAIYIGANVFGSTFHARVWALNKAQMYAGQPLTAPTPHDLMDGAASVSSPTPMQLHGAPSVSGTQYIVSDDTTFSGNTFGIWIWTDPTGATAPTLVGYADLQAATGVGANFPVDQAQLGTQVQLQANDVRTLDAEWRNGKLWIAHQMSCNVGAGAMGCARWAEINPLDASVTQAGVVTIYGKSISFPNLAVDANDNMALGFTVSGPTKRPSVYVAARAATDPPGTLRDAQLVKAGGSIYSAFDGSPNRWGDYSGLTSDPDGQHLWYLGEYSKAGLLAPYVPGQYGNWGTFVQEIGFGPDDHIFAGNFDPLRASLEVHTEVNLDDADSIPGLTVNSGESAALRYVVINTGQQVLNNLQVVDSQLGTINCPTNSGTLDVGEDILCEADGGIVSDGQHTNTATVTAVAADGTAVGGQDSANYFGFTTLVGVTCTSAGGTGCPEPLMDSPSVGTYGSVTSNFTISGCNTIDDVNVGLSIDHTYVGDLLITLTSPDNTIVRLLNSPIAGNDSCPGDNLRAMLDDASGNGGVDFQCGSGTPSIFGEFQPSQPLSAFNGAVGNGTWTLTVYDVYPQDTGTLNDWSLQMTCH